MDRTLRWSLALLGGLLVVLLSTGIYLVFRYEPLGLLSSYRVPNAWLIRLADTTHRVTAWALLALTGIILVQCLVLAAPTAGRLIVIPGLGLVIGTAGALYAGTRLVWDQLALPAGTVGQSGDLRGYQFLFGNPEVLWVLLPSGEVGLGTLRRWFWVHVLVLPLALIALVIVIVVMKRPMVRRMAGAPLDEGSLEAPERRV